MAVFIYKIFREINSNREYSVSNVICHISIISFLEIDDTKNGNEENIQHETIISNRDLIVIDDIKEE